MFISPKSENIVNIVKVILLALLCWFKLVLGWTTCLFEQCLQMISILFFFILFFFSFFFFLK